MSAESEPLESYFDSDSLSGLIRSGWTMIRARRVRPRDESDNPRLHPFEIRDALIYFILIIVPAIILDLFQRVRTMVTRKPRRHTHGAWQFYLETGLRGDLAHFTNETTGYHEERPESATELDDLTAWTMAVIQFLWHYDDLMAAVWDEWTILRLVSEAAEEAGLHYDREFLRLRRQWEVQRPYNAPLNGTYADIRRARFNEFIEPRLNALPDHLRKQVLKKRRDLGALHREAYQRQMSLLAHTVPGRFMDTRRPIKLWDARIGLIVCGKYYLLHVVDHDEEGIPIVYGVNGRQWRLNFDSKGQPITPIGDQIFLREDQFYRVDDGQAVGFLDMAPASRVKWQLQHILGACPEEDYPHDNEAVDVLLAESPRNLQKGLRRLLPKATRVSLEELQSAPVIINWDRRSRETSLGEVRRAQRGIGDNALTIIRTDGSFVFDQSHIYFDGTWSMEMAEVLTNTAITWCERVTTLHPSHTFAVKPLILQPSPEFLNEARKCRQQPEITAETTIWDISNIFSLRKMLRQTGTMLTINDLLVITRIFHAAHYKPSPSVQTQIDEFREAVRTPVERRAVAAIERSLERGNVTNPSLLIPVDASATDPAQRLFPIPFRNLAENLVWAWDDTWDAYQGYRKHDPANTPEGIAAFKAFALERTRLVGNLRAFSFILDANKAVAVRGDSISVGILRLLVGLPTWLQHTVKMIAEYATAINEIVRGDEVYSNVGRVVKSSSLKRFMTAKDDGNTKALAWGIMTDDDGRLIVTMRDFRPHINPLIRAGRIDLARNMAQNYVETYTADLIGLVARLSAMLQAESPVAQKKAEPTASTTP